MTEVSRLAAGALLVLLPLCGGAVLVTAVLAGGADAPKVTLADFARPAGIPYPGTAAPTAEQVALGARLFRDPRLSGNGKIACATCHDPDLAFSDGVERGKGITNETLPRHTPTIWNLAWNEALFWDGRATSLEDQAKGPIENPKEMGQPIGDGAKTLAADPDMVAAFGKAFPADPGVTPANIQAALADYERTMVSPPTKFDRYVAGDEAALNDSEKNGFKLFTGRGNCVSCHSGWAFTDRAFHDIGLPGDDRGRGAILNLAKVDHAFKTPSLRELAWTAPYMHDGSKATLEDVVRHYESGGIDRPTRSPDLPKSLQLSDDERRDLVAFLETLSSELPPKPDPSIAFLGAPPPLPPAVTTSQVSQRNKAFTPLAVKVKRGETLKIFNDDTRPHNVRVFDPRLTFDSGLQEPGESASVAFNADGTFEVFCGIHPSMKLRVMVEP